MRNTVTLIAPNGQRVSVAESKKVERLAAGYRIPRKRPGPKPGGTAKSGAGNHPAAPLSGSTG